MLKKENLLNQKTSMQEDGVFYGLVDGFAANYSEEQLNIIYEFLSSGSSVTLPKDFVTNETLSSVTCSNLGTLQYADFSNVTSIEDILNEGSNLIKSKSIYSNINPTAIQYWDQVCNIESINKNDLIIGIFAEGISSLTLAEKVINVLEYQGSYIITRLDTNKAIQVYQQSGSYYIFASNDVGGSSIEDYMILTTKDIGKTIPFKIEWSPSIPN